MVEIGIGTKCSACGTDLSQEGHSSGLCPSCLLELALDDTSLEAELDLGEAPTLQFSPEQSFSEGEIQGDRYRIRSLLGRGGMGEVWRAYDLKLRLDVALKALRKDLITDPHALETLRQEVRVAREVVSPNVCRVFDLEELDGQELISMEYVDGTTLQEILRDRGPLELNEAREIASQFLAGLEAIHEAGLVHRDIKPENLMITRTGRVVVMDFGIAKGLQEGKSGVIAGTPAYMSPEQARGSELDARGDLFSAGVVLAEMVEPGGMCSFEDRRQLWEGIHQESPRVSETPWSKVIATVVSPDPEGRLASAAALARALEEVTLRATGDEEARPYPGLSAFQEEDAEFFYGRELEVEALWKKLRRPHLMALIGASGAGKSSFLRAGLLPTLPEGWRAIVVTPGSRPFDNLARALEQELGTAPGAPDLLLRFEEPGIAVELLSEWRQAHKRALVIVDQFEELFTQNPRQVQVSFAELLGDLPLRGDVHVLLSMRDDFLLHCQSLEPLAPVFSEMTPLGPPTGASLRRAIVQPALKCGYRFEDESLVEEMLGEVEGERGSLPMVAFAVARLWENRNRDKGLLTRETYAQIGGVGGALAQHAEATLERIGEDRIPIVRELFRNLVTAQGTRAARDREELLSVFGGVGAGLRAGPREGTEVLNTLIDSRLLTSYETPASEDGDIPHHRIEIVHESLLSNWPRLVRWQMQDAEGAKIRDELRHQAQLWEQHDRSFDYLWTGTAFREFQLWSERYPGGLTTTEGEFARAMTAHAERRKRRRRVAVSVVVLLALVVATVMGGLWLRSEAEARRAEASKLLALAQLRLEDDPTEALAYTTASLEVADSEDARLFAVRVLYEAPPALELVPGGSDMRTPAFSPDGRRMAVGSHSEEVRVFTVEGGPATVLPGHARSPKGPTHAKWASNELLVTGLRIENRRRLWSLPDGRLLRTFDSESPTYWQVGKNRLLAEVIETDVETGHELYHLRSWRLPDGEPVELGTVDWTALGGSWSFFDFGGDRWIYGKGKSVFYRPLPVREGTPDQFVGSHDNQARHTWFPRTPDFYWTRDATTGEMRQWDLSSDRPRLAEVIPSLESEPAGRIPGPSGRWAVSRHFALSDREARVWDLEAGSQGRPLRLRRGGSWYGAASTFHPSGDWLVVSTQNLSRLTFWPLGRAWPRVVDGYSSITRCLAFSPDGRWLATSWETFSGVIRLWPLPGNDSLEVRTLVLPEEELWRDLAFDSQGRFLFIVSSEGRAYVVPLDGSPPRRLEGFSEDTLLDSAAVSPSGRRVATAFYFGGGPRTLRIWDLETGDSEVLDLPEGSPSNTGYERGIRHLAFADESTLYTAGDGGIRRWNLESGAHRLVLPTKPGYRAAMAVGPDAQTALVHLAPLSDQSNDLGPLWAVDLATGASRALREGEPCEGRSGVLCPLDVSGTVAVSGDRQGIVRVERLSGGEPHLLLGHEGPVDFVAISPDGQWIASTGGDSTLRLWPMPDLDQAPLHTLPRDELLAKLKNLTNIRVVRDPESTDGWKVTLDPFPGWKEVPTWQ